MRLSRLVGAFFWLGLLFGSPLGAQTVLLTEYKGSFRAVVRARGAQPYVMFEGKEVAAEGRRYALHKVEEFLPLFVSIRRLDVTTQYVNLNGSDINHEFKLVGELVSDYPMESVFIVLELDTESAGKVVFMAEVGRLEPRVPHSLALRVPMSSPLGSGTYTIHLYTRGTEVFHSNIDAGFRDVCVDRMTAKRIAGVTDARPTLFLGPQPEYPPSLWKSRVSGNAVVAMRIGANGRVHDPVVKRATDPAFAESALTAVRLWRFLPMVKAGVAVETQAEIPLEFTPPPKSPKKP